MNVPEEVTLVTQTCSSISDKERIDQLESKVALLSQAALLFLKMKNDAEQLMISRHEALEQIWSSRGFPKEGHFGAPPQARFQIADNGGAAHPILKVSSLEEHTESLNILRKNAELSTFLLNSLSKKDVPKSILETEKKTDAPKDKEAIETLSQIMALQAKLLSIISP